MPFNGLRNFCTNIVKVARLERQLSNPQERGMINMKRRVINMRQWLLIAWIWLTTGIMVGFVLLTFPTEFVTASPSPMVAVAPAKPRCMLGIVKDVNNCGVWTRWACRFINSVPGGTGTGNGQQCEIRRIWQLQIQGRQRVDKERYDCNGDGQADCEIWWGWFQLKGCYFGPSGNSTLLDPFSSTTAEECVCPTDSTQ